MKSGIAVAFALAVFFSAMAVPFVLNDSSDAESIPESVTIKGIVIEIGEATQEAVKNVSVTLTSTTESTIV